MPQYNKTEPQKGEIIMTKTIYVFRHGQTDYNVARRVMGQMDIPLNDVGRVQATELANKLAPVKIGAIYSSPLARAMETAQAVADKIGAPIITDKRLMERNNGKLQGHIVHGTNNPAEYQMDYNQMELFWPAAQLNDDNWQPDGGESRTECWALGNRVPNVGPGVGRQLQTLPKTHRMTQSPFPHTAALCVAFWIWSVWAIQKSAIVIMLN